MQNILVTGANRGIGLGLTKRFLQAGHNVIAACRNPDGARDLWEIEADYKGRLKLLELDVSNFRDIETLPQRLPSLPSLDILINCAGVYLDGREGIRDFKIGNIEKTFQVNVFGAMLVTQVLAPLLDKAPKPIVINISSQMGSIADNSSGTSYGYRMSKTAMNMFTKNLALDCPKWVSIAMHPGWVQTDMGGPNAKVSVNDSVEGIFKVIADAKPAHNGAFLNFRGEALPW